MNTKLFVRSLSYEIDDKALENIFSSVGKVVSAKVIRTPGTEQSKGFGFVEMSTAEEAKRAINELNNTLQNGRNIMVLEAKPSEKSGGRSGSGRSSDSWR